MQRKTQLLVYTEKNHPVTLSIELDEKTYSSAQVPDSSRNSTVDAVILRELQGRLSRDAMIGSMPTTKDHFATLQYLRNHLHAYQAYQLFTAEYADIIRETRDEKNSAEPVTPEVFKTLQEHGLFAMRLIPDLAEKHRKILNQQLQARHEKKSQHSSYRKTVFQGDTDDPSTLSIVRYFQKIGVTQDNNHRTPEDYLADNFDRNAKDPLLHVRCCEDVFCTMNPHKSNFIKSIEENTVKQILNYMRANHPDKNKTVFYGGFASGLLLRDLKIIKALIDEGYKKFEILFLDKGYEKLLKQTTDEVSDLKMEDEISMNLQAKAFNEFANYLALHTDSVNIHIFSNIQQATVFFANKTDAEKLTLLVGQDYFTQNGCSHAAFATPDAHGDFMNFAKIGLRNWGAFFECVKNDMTQKIYLHAGLISEEQYIPWFTNVNTPSDWDVSKQNTTVYPNTSLGFFEKCNDKPTECAKGKNFVVYQNNKIIDGTEVAKEMVLNAESRHNARALGLKSQCSL